VPTNQQFSQLGWQPDKPDSRDQLYQPSFQELPPARVDIAPPFPCYDQGQIASCTANALAAAVQYDRLQAGDQPAFQPSRLFLYYNERAADNHPAIDAGSTLRTGLKCLQQQGICPEDDWTYDDTAPPQGSLQFPPNAKAAQPPQQPAFDAALNYTITSYQRIYQPILMTLQACLASGLPFVFGFSVYASWFNTKPANIPLPSQNDSLIGGHAVMCVGYDSTTRYFKIRNSWGTAVGDNGYFYMPFEYMTGGPSYTDDFWVINAVKA
jgi:C1A family cysteine protease